MEVLMQGNLDPALKRHAPLPAAQLAALCEVAASCLESRACDRWVAYPPLPSKQRLSSSCHHKNKPKFAFPLLARPYWQDHTALALRWPRSNLYLKLPWTLITARNKTCSPCLLSVQAGQSVHFQSSASPDTLRSSYVLCAAGTGSRHRQQGLSHLVGALPALQQPI